MNFSGHFNDGLHGSADTINTSDNIGGYSISHDMTDQTFPTDFDNFANPMATHRQHNASMGSIDSIFNHPAPVSPVYNVNRTSPAVNTNEKDASPRKGSEDPGHEHTPTWSELKTKAGKERKRLPLACIACRRKKIKCSGEKPACKHCLKARIPCVYKVTTRKAAPRTDYMAMLDKRLKRMEDRVIKIIPKEELPDPTTRSTLRPPLPGTTPKNDKDEAQTKRSAEEAFSTEIQTWGKSRTGNTPLDGAARTRGPRDTENKLFTEGTEALPPQHIQEHLVEVYFDCVYGQSYLLLHKPSFMRKLKAGVVPPVLILSICAISARFSTHPQVSTEPAFLRGEKWATPARSILERRHFEPNITILTCMVMLGLHYFGTCEGGLSWSFGGQAMRMAYALQLHKELDHDPLGLAQAERAAASGKPVPQIQELSFTDREIRRRVMWSCYLMDTFNSSGTERPSFLSEEYMFIQLPIKEVHFQMELPGRTEDLEGHVPLTSTKLSADDAQAEARANMGVAAYIVRAVVLWKRVVKYLNLGGKEKDSHQMWDPLSQFANLQRQANQLKSSLPSSLTYNADNLAAHVTERLANQFIFLHLTIAQNLLFLHRFAVPTAPNTRRAYPPNTPKSFLASAATTTVDAASQISRLLADSTGHTLTVPFAGYCAYASATVHIWGIFSKNAALESVSRDNLRHCYKYLNRMKRYWAMFHYMAESVKDAYRAFSDAANRLAKKQSNIQGTSSGASDPFENLGASSNNADVMKTEADEDGLKTEGSKVKVFQYGDWFDKYPHGVSEQEWERSHHPHRVDHTKESEAIMSQQSELQSVEEFFASLSPPSKAEDAANKRRAARKRGKSTIDEKHSNKSKEQTTQENARKSSHGANQQPQSSNDSVPHRSSQSLASNSMYPLSERTFPQLDLSTSDIDVPMSGVSAGLQSGQGNSAFDGTSPTNMMSTGGSMDQSYLLSSSISNPQRMSQVPQQAQAQANSPYDYVSPASSSNMGGGGSNTTKPGSMNFNFNYTSAVPQLDRQMVFSGYAGIDPSTSGSTGALNNINNSDFWNNPWDSQFDVDGFTGFNDPSFGLNTGTVGSSSTTTEDRRRNPSAHFNNAMSTAQSKAAHNNSSTAFFMPFNIEPPSSTHFGASSGSMPSFDDFSGLDSMMDMGAFGFSPEQQQQQQQQHDGGG